MRTSRGWAFGGTNVSFSARVGVVARILAVGMLSVLSLPGVRAARAETDLVPPASELFAWNSPVRTAPSGPVSCSPRSDAARALAEARRQAALARIGELMKAGPGRGEVLNGRGYAYPTVRDPYQELRRVELEAQRQRAQRAAEARQP
jgi:hypothetical protein